MAKVIASSKKMLNFASAKMRLSERRLRLDKLGGTSAKTKQA